ncbi:HU family DNA-binding protein [Endozoicomonas sp.]|nr:HU family DNA-binding protein [Endozoicomonas sp.]
MNKKKLIKQVSTLSGLSRNKAEQTVNAFINQTQDTLSQGDNIQLIGFGTFSVADRAARKGRNPQTGQEIHIPACKLPQFKAGHKLKGAIK